jgi:hypothetical protein
MVKEGYRISGIWPISVPNILSGWSGWSQCNETTAVKVMRLVPE